MKRGAKVAIGFLVFLVLVISISLMIMSLSGGGKKILTLDPAASCWNGGIADRLFLLSPTLGTRRIKIGRAL